ncbi:MAG: hypothetical protein V2J16_09890 [Thermoleophilia bacterium]|nr:hypothetical protein [Thermoleophilia bacterium]
MRRRLTLLAGLALFAVASVAVGASGAWFHSESDSYLSVQAAHVQDWLHVYAEDTDPGGLTGYAIRRLSDPPVPAASGQDDALVVDLGGFPDANATFDFVRTVTVVTPAAFPDPAVTQVTVAATLLPDPATGSQLLRQVKLVPVGGTKGAGTVTMAVGEQYQVDLTVRTRKQFDLGQTYAPRVVLTLTYAGGPADYFVWEIPMTCAIVGL